MPRTQNSRDDKMKHKLLPLLIITALICLAILQSYQFKTYATNIEWNLEGIKIDKIHQTIEILDGGTIIVNETVFISAQNGEKTLKMFPIGFPYKYAAYLLRCFAYDDESDKIIPVISNTGLGKTGFYGITIDFTKIGGFYVNVSKSFTVTFVFFGIFEPQLLEPNILKMEFPLYPSLTKQADTCNTTLIVPESLLLNYTSVEFEKRWEWNKRSYFSTKKIPLEAFSLEEFEAKLRIIGTYNLVEIGEMKRQISIGQGELDIRDHFLIKNLGRNTLSSIKFSFPNSSRDFRIQNEFGSIVEGADVSNNEISFPSLQFNESIKLVVIYKVPSDQFLKENNGKFTVIVGIQRIYTYVAKKLIVEISLPQGAKLQTIQNCSFSPSKIERKNLIETVTFTLENYTPYTRFYAEIIYSVNPLWASYGPVLWAGAAAAVVCVVALSWRIATRPTVAPPPAKVLKEAVSPRIFRKFVENYEKRSRMSAELERLESRVRRGKIPRRQYKVRKKMLEGRISSINKELVVLKERIRNAGPKYADIIRELEVAEAELEEVEIGIKRIESRYRRGEISRAVYRRLLEDHERRKERAQLAIEGALLRLKEETH